MTDNFEELVIDVRASTDGFASDVEAMVAAAPSRDNPFLTQRNRRRRAHFLLAQRQAAVRHQVLRGADAGLGHGRSCCNRLCPASVSR